jgi:hypothetical protein
MAEKNTIGLYKLNTDHEELRESHSVSSAIAKNSRTLHSKEEKER